MLSRSLGKSISWGGLKNAVQRMKLQNYLGGAGGLCGKELHSLVEGQSEHRMHPGGSLRLLEYSRSLSSHVNAGSTGKGEKSETRGGGLGVVSKKDKAKAAIGGFKELWAKYGMVAVGTYLGVYVTTLGFIFVSLDYDLFSASTFGLNPEDAIHKVADIIESTTGSKQFPSYIKENPRMGTFSIAWVMTKFTEPARFFLTVGIVPPLSRVLGYSPPKEATDA